MGQANVMDRYDALCRAHRAEVDAKRAARIAAEKLEAGLAQLVRRFDAKRRKAKRKGR